MSTANTNIAEKLKTIAQAVRQQLHTYYENEPFWTIGLCWSASQLLEKAIQDAGYPAKRYGGYYNDCEDGYIDNIIERFGGLDEDNGDFDIETWDHRWKHWWVVCNEFIIDITADQFHPSDPEPYQIVVTNFSDTDYSMHQPSRKH